MLKLLQVPKILLLSCHSPLVPMSCEQKPDFIWCGYGLLPGEGSWAIFSSGPRRRRHAVPVPPVSLLWHGQPEGGSVYFSAGFSTTRAEQSSSHHGPGSREREELALCWFPTTPLYSIQTPMGWYSPTISNPPSLIFSGIVLIGTPRGVPQSLR